MENRNITQDKSFKPHPSIEERFSLKQISKLTGVTVYALNRRSLKLHLKGRCTGKDSTKYYTRKQIDKILLGSRISCENHSRKIDIIEIYLQGISARRASEVLKISVKLAYDCVREFNKTGCVTVESKISRIL